MRVWRFTALPGIQPVQPAHQVPGSHPVPPPRQEKIRGKLPGQRGIALQETRKVAPEKLRSQRLKGRTAHQMPVGVVERNVEGGKTHERRQERHRFCQRHFPVRFLQNQRQDLFLKILAHLHRMPALAKTRPAAGNPPAEIAHPIQTRTVGQRAGPDPLDAQRRLAPAFGALAVPAPDSDPDPEAFHLGEGFRPELERNPCPHGKQMHADLIDCGLMTFGNHGYSGRGLPLVSGASQISAIPSRYTSVTTAPARE